MKCIKSIKATKNTEVGVLVRTSDVEAESKVKTGYWAYAPKSEYKTWKRGTTTLSRGRQSQGFIKFRPIGYKRCWNRRPLD